MRKGGKMKNSSIVLAVVAAAIISGCATVDTQQIARSMYNVRETGVSEVDGTKYVRMKNIACSGDQVIRLDLYQDSRLARANQAILKVKVTGVHSIGGGKSLHFNIDGEFMDLETADQTTDMEEVFAAQYAPGYVGGGTYVAPAYSPAIRASTKRYPISEKIIEKIGKAKRVVVRVDLSGSYVEGLCSPRESGWTKENEWVRELTGTEGFRGFSEMTRTLD